MALLGDQLPWLASSPLNLQGIPHEVPYEALRWIPRFGNNGNVSAQEHLLNFSHALTSLAITHEDVAVKLLVHSFEGPAAEWFQSLPPGSISSWVDIATRFKRVFPEYLDPQTLIDEFCKMRKQVHEFANDFNVRFRKAFMQIPEDFRPHDRLALQIYCNALDPHLSYAVRREKPYTLFDAMNVTIEIEQQMISSRLIPMPFQRQHSTSLAYPNHNTSHEALIMASNGIHETMENLSKEIIALQLETQQGGEDMKPYQNQNLAPPPNVTPTHQGAYGATSANNQLDEAYLDVASFNFPRFVPGRSKRKEDSRVKQSRHLDQELSGNTSTSTKMCQDEAYTEDGNVGVHRTQANEIASSAIGTSQINELHLEMPSPASGAVNRDDISEFVVSNKAYSNLGLSTSWRSCDGNVDVADVELQEDACEIPTIDQFVINRCPNNAATSQNDMCLSEDTQNEIDLLYPHCEEETNQIERDDSHDEVGIQGNTCSQPPLEIDLEYRIPYFETFHFDDNTKTEQSNSEDQNLSSDKGMETRNLSNNINHVDGNEDSARETCGKSLPGNMFLNQNHKFLQDACFETFIFESQVDARNLDLAKTHMFQGQLDVASFANKSQNLTDISVQEFVHTSYVSNPCATFDEDSLSDEEEGDDEWDNESGVNIMLYNPTFENDLNEMCAFDNPLFEPGLLDPHLLPSSCPVTSDYTEPSQIDREWVNPKPIDFNTHSALDRSRFSSVNMYQGLSSITFHSIGLVLFTCPTLSNGIEHLTILNLADTYSKDLIRISNIDQLDHAIDYCPVDPSSYTVTSPSYLTGTCFSMLEPLLVIVMCSILKLSLDFMDLSYLYHFYPP